MYDGTGYPDGLSGENIHIGARILAVADTFDNMVTSKGSYIGLSDEEAIGILRKNSGKKFDPIVVEAFIRIHPVVRREEIEKGRLKKREIREEGKKEIRIGTHTVWERYT
jgi:response regulator RpfG family c-di-GMP phosphodiesterase